MMEDPRNISFCAHLLFCSKNIARIGDRATIIAKTVVYLVTLASRCRLNGRTGTKKRTSAAGDT